MNSRVELLRGHAGSAGREPAQRSRSRGPGNPVSCDVPIPGAHRGVFEGQTQLRFACLQRVLSLPELSDVSANALQLDDLPIVIADGAVDPLHRTDASVESIHLVLGCQWLRTGHEQ